MEFLPLLPATIIGFVLFRLMTGPNSRIWQKIPHVKTKRLQIFPSLRIRLFGRVIHFHHWLNFSILLVMSVFENSGILASNFTKGLLLGGILQGLALPSEHRKLVYKHPHPSPRYPTL